MTDDTTERARPADVALLRELAEAMCLGVDAAEYPDAEIRWEMRTQAARLRELANVLERLTPEDVRAVRSAGDYLRNLVGRGRSVEKHLVGVDHERITTVAKLLARLVEGKP